MLQKRKREENKTKQMNQETKVGDPEGPVSWEKTLSSSPTAPFEQYPIHGVEPPLGAIAPTGAQGGAGVKTNKEDENKLSVETLKGSSRPRLLSQMGARCRASEGIVLPQVLVLGAKLKNKGGWGGKGRCETGLFVQLFSLCVCVCLSRRRKL